METIPAAINQITHRYCEDFVSRSECPLDIQTIAGATVVGFAACESTERGIEAGIEMARACMGTMAKVSVLLDQPAIDAGVTWDEPKSVFTETGQPLVACMGCQYAGWPLSVDDFFAMTSGPVRMLRGKEPVLEHYGLIQTDKSAVAMMESAQAPTARAIAALAEEISLSPELLTVWWANTASLAGRIQIVARSVETAIHKLHELKFDLRQVISGSGSAPIPPATKSDLEALGWTNDAMLYGADVELVVDAEDDQLGSLIDQVPSCSSAEFGRPFIDLFNHYDRDFYKIDPMLFSPARITLVNRRTGSQFSAGELRYDLLRNSFESKQ